MTYKSSNINGLLFLVCIAVLSSCGTSRYLTDNQFLVKKNKVVILDKKNSKDDTELIYNLEALVIQKPNTNYQGASREAIYLRNKIEYDTTENKRGRLKEAQLPVLHDDELMRQTAVRMEKYLRNSKGFYFAKVVPSAYLSQKQARITYTVITDARYTVRSKEYFIEDPEIKRLVDKYEPRTLIKPGTKIDESIFEAEKTRIFTKLQDKGYAAFAKNYIEFQADSSNMQMDVFVRIIAPPNEKYHKKYTIGKITVYPNYRGIKDDNSPFKQTFKNVDYQFVSDEPYMNASTLNRMIQIKEGQLYKKRDVDNTYSSLSKLGTYKFINITSDVRADVDSIVDYNIFLTPIDDIWATDASLNLFYTFLAQDGGNINRIGLSGITTLSNINTFGGGEKLTLSAEATSEFTVPQLNTNLTFSLQAGLKFPILVDYRNMIHNLVGIFHNDEKLLKYRNNTKTEYFASYGYIQQIGQYTTHSTIASSSYEYIPDNKFRYIFTPFSVNSLSTNVDSTFRADFLDTSPFFARSFDKRFITTFFIPQLLYQMSSPVFSSGFNWNIKINTEVSGLEVLSLNGLFNLATNSQDTWAIDLGQNNIFEFSRFALVDIDVNATQKLNDKHSIAGRYHMGVGVPFLKNDVIPYIRQFYVGGANSLRAWQTRELGPGAFRQPNIDSPVFFQSGDIVLEASLEYRFPIYAFVEGAVFVDAGNVWTIRDTDRPESQFKFNQFYNQIAIGTGYGFRIDLNFIIIRLDLGYRLRNPYTSNEFKYNYWSFPDWEFVSVRDYIRNPNFTIGLNYPF